MKIFATELKNNYVFLAALLLLAVQLLLVGTGALVRYTCYNAVGLYNRQVKWPTSYKFKLALQSLNIILVAGEVGLTIWVQNDYDLLKYGQLIVQLFIWSISLMMFRFEFRRALGHVWYMHPLTWGYTSLYYCAVLYFQMKYILNKNHMLPFYILVGCQAFMTILLTWLSIAYPQDSPQLRKTTYAANISDLNLNLLDQNDNFDIENSQAAQELLTDIPRIRAKVTSQISFDQRANQISFEIFSKSQGTLVANCTVKRDYPQFKALDAQLHQIYSDRNGVMFQWPKIAHAKITDLATIEAQREKLNAYLQELLSVFETRISTTESNDRAQVPAVLLKFLGFDDDFVENYHSLFARSFSRYKSTRSSTALAATASSYGFVDTGDLKQDCKIFICRIIDSSTIPLFKVEVKALLSEQAFQIIVNSDNIGIKTPVQVKRFCQLFHEWNLPALREIGQSIIQMNEAKEISPNLEYLLRQMLNDPLQHSTQLVDFLDNPKFSMLTTLQLALNQGLVDLSKEIILWVNLTATLQSYSVIIDSDGSPYNEYTINIRRTSGELKEWTSKVIVSDLISFLQMYCPAACDEEKIPLDLVDEAERNNDRNNGKLLIKYLNEVVFQDYRCICANGMREYFVTTAQQRELSYSELRGSSLRRLTQDYGLHSSRSPTSSLKSFARPQAQSPDLGGLRSSFKNEQDFDCQLLPEIENRFRFNVY